MMFNLELHVYAFQSGRPFEPQQTATILSHMAGHILGIEHDEDGRLFTIISWKTPVLQLIEETNNISI